MDSRLFSTLFLASLSLSYIGCAPGGIGSSGTPPEPDSGLADAGTDQDQITDAEVGAEDAGVEPDQGLEGLLVEEGPSVDGSSGFIYAGHSFQKIARYQDTVYIYTSRYQGDGHPLEIFVWRKQGDGAWENLYQINFGGLPNMIVGPDGSLHLFGVRRMSYVMGTLDYANAWIDHVYSTGLPNPSNINIETIVPVGGGAQEVVANFRIGVGINRTGSLIISWPTMTNMVAVGYKWASSNSWTFFKTLHTPGRANQYSYANPGVFESVIVTNCFSTTISSMPGFGMISTQDYASWPTNNFGYTGDEDHYIVDDLTERPGGGHLVAVGKFGAENKRIVYEKPAGTNFFTGEAVVPGAASRIRFVRGSDNTTINMLSVTNATIIYGKIEPGELVPQEFVDVVELPTDQGSYYVAEIHTPSPRGGNFESEFIDILVPQIATDNSHERVLYVRVPKTSLEALAQQGP